MTLDFDVTVATEPGVYHNNAAAEGEDVAVTPTGPTAPITVLPTISIDDVTVTEGNSETTDATFTVSLNGASADPVTVDFATANGSAIAPGDYTRDDRRARLRAGRDLEADHRARQRGHDLRGERDFFVNLANASGATIVDGQGVGTIENDDAAPTLAIGNVSQTEGNDGATTFTLHGDEDGRDRACRERRLRDRGRRATRARRLRPG